MQDYRVFRFLEKEERPLARALWEEIFPEDSEEFLNVYENIREDNRIAGCLEKGRLLSMVQANPFQVWNGTESCGKVHYLVGVATRPSCRHRGYMKNLLHLCLEADRKEGIPFTFLMPVDPAIYEPFGFVTVYEQQTWRGDAWLSDLLWKADPCLLPKLPGKKGEYTLRELTGEEAAAWADWEAFLEEEADVFCRRNRRYLRDLVKELGSENGRLFVFERQKAEERISPAGEETGLEGKTSGSCEETGLEGKTSASCEGAGPGGKTSASCEGAVKTEPERIAGGFLAAWPGKPCEIREIAGEEAWQAAVFPHLEKPDHRPRIMLRLVSPEAFVKPVSSGEKRTVLLYLRDAFLTENTGWYVWIINREGSSLRRLSTEEETGLPAVWKEKTEENQDFSLHFVDSGDKSVDMSTEQPETNRLHCGQLRGKVDDLWITSAENLVRWRFDDARTGLEGELHRKGRIFINETV